MNKEQELFFKILKRAIHGETFLIDSVDNADTVDFVDEETMSKHFLRQDLASIVCGAQQEKCFPLLHKKATEEMIQFYRILAFFRELNGMLQKEQIHYYVLKGFGLCGLYPKEEMRCMSDIDIYVPDKNHFKKVQRLFEEKNYKVSSCQTEHHVEYYCASRNGIIKCELHAQLVYSLGNKKDTKNAEKLFLKELGNQVVMNTFLNVTFPTLPPTLDLWYNLMHMLHHFLGYGVGIRPLCDITLFMEKRGNEIDYEKMENCLKASGMSNFMGVILTLCRELLGLKNPMPEYPPSEYAWDFFEDIWNFDENTRVRERSPIDMNRNKIVSYVALCHRQMKYRFPKASKIPLLWPVLWCVTIVHFLKNKKRDSVDVILQRNEHRRKLAFHLLKNK